MKYTFDADGPTQKEIQYYEMFGTRALWHEGWHVVAQRAPQQGGTAADFVNDTWELYHSEEDRAELHDLAASTPTRSRSWSTSGTSRPASTTCCRSTTGRSEDLVKDDAGRRDPGGRRSTATTPTPRRCRSSPPRRSGAGRSRSSPRSSSTDADAEGVLLANGARFGGHTLFIKDRKLWYVNNFLGIPPEQQLVSPDDADGRRPRARAWSSRRRATASTARPSAPPRSTSTTWPSRRASWKTQPGHFALCGEGLTVGRDSSDPVIEGVRRAVRLHRRPDPGRRDQHRRRPLPRPRARLPRRPGARLSGPGRLSRASRSVTSGRLCRLSGGPDRAGLLRLEPVTECDAVLQG